jgi:hypothetical protein
MRVLVPLGKRRVMGVVVEVVSGSALAGGKLKHAIAFPDPEPLLPPDILDLCLFAARYYHAMPGEAVVNTLPAALRSLPKAVIRTPRQWCATPESGALPASALSRSPRLAAALAFLREQGAASDAACRLAGIQPAHLRAWGYLGLACERLGDLEAAREAFERGGHTPRVRRMDARLAEREGDPLAPPSDTSPRSESWQSLDIGHLGSPDDQAVPAQSAGRVDDLTAVGPDVDCPDPLDRHLHALQQDLFDYLLHDLLDRDLHLALDDLLDRDFHPSLDDLLDRHLDPHLDPAIGDHPARHVDPEQPGAGDEG